MADKIGIESLKKVVKSAAEVGNIVSRILNKAGLLSLLELQGPLASLISVKWDLVKQEVKDLDMPERLELEKTLSDTFSPVNPAVDATVDKFLTLAEKSIVAIEKGIADGHEVYETVKVLVEEWKSLLGAS